MDTVSRLNFYEPLLTQPPHPPRPLWNVFLSKHFISRLLLRMHVSWFSKEWKRPGNWSSATLENWDSLVPDQYQPTDSAAQWDLRHRLGHVAIPTGIPQDLWEQVQALVQQDLPLGAVWTENVSVQPDLPDGGQRRTAHLPPTGAPPRGVVGVGTDIVHLIAGSN